MKISETFTSNYIRAADITRPMTLTIESCGMESMGGDEHKPVVGFRGAKKGLVLNKTNAMTLVSLYGDDTGGWVGRPIELFTMKVQGPSGSIVDGIRLRPPAAGTPNAQAAEQQNNNVQQSQDMGQPFDDDIPF